MVGLSIGGLIERLYRQQFPTEVAGMVIVDHAFLDVLPDNDVLPDKPAASVQGPDSPPVPISQTPITFTVEESSHFENLPARSQELLRWATSPRPAPLTVDTAGECLAQLKIGPMGNIPLAVVSTANDNPKYANLQNELLELSPHTRQFIADKSFHSIEIDQPDVAVRAVVAGLR